MPRYFAYAEAKKEEAEMLGQVKMLGAMMEELCERYPFINIEANIVIRTAERDEYLTKKYTYTTNINFKDGTEF